MNRGAHSLLTRCQLVETTVGGSRFRWSKEGPHTVSGVCGIERRLKSRDINRRIVRGVYSES